MGVLRVHQNVPEFKIELLCAQVYFALGRFSLLFNCSVAFCWHVCFIFVHSCFCLGMLECIGMRASFCASFMHNETFASRH